jgi:hypothetical protein
MVQMSFAALGVPSGFSRSVYLMIELKPYAAKVGSESPVTGRICQGAGLAEGRSSEPSPASRSPLADATTKATQSKDP